MVLIRFANKNDALPFVWRSLLIITCVNVICAHMTNAGNVSESEKLTQNLNNTFGLYEEKWPSLNFTTEKSYSQKKEDSLFMMDRVSLQIVVSVLGSAGVFVLCCVCCAHMCTPVRNYRMREIERYMASYALVQQDGQVVSSPRNRPWNHHSFGFHSEPFSDYNECSDKPPQYDDLEHCQGLQDPSTPPPPYSPSFTKISHDSKNATKTTNLNENKTNSSEV